MSGPSRKPATILVIMGVAGSGKTTVGKQVAARLGWPFFDADDFHSRENINKMSCGIPLTSLDRMPWLHLIHSHMKSAVENNQSCVYACSALKNDYRERLTGNLSSVKFVYLKANFKTLQERLSRRIHFAGPELLTSQFQDLEEPVNAVFVDCEKSIQDVVADVVNVVGMYACPSV